MIIKANGEDRIKMFTSRRSRAGVLYHCFLNTYFVYDTAFSTSKEKLTCVYGKGDLGVYSRSQGGASLKKCGKP